MFKRYEQNENCAQDVDLDANAFLIVANDANAAIHPITPWPPGFTEDLLWWSQVRDISRVVARLPRSEAKTGEGGEGRGVVCFFLVGFSNLELVPSCLENSKSF